MPSQSKVDLKKQKMDYISNLNARVSSLEKRVSLIEGSPSSSATASKKKPLRVVGIVLLVLGGFFILFGGFFSMFISRGSPFISGLISLLAWSAAILGIIFLASSNGSSSTPSSEEEPDVSSEKEEILKEAPVKRTLTKTAKKITPSKKETHSTEANIGMKWFARIGIISLVLSVAFFIIYAIQNKLIGPTGQIAIGILIGIILLVLGEFFDKKEKYIGYARTLTGGGFAILYFAIYAAYAFYKLIPNQWLDMLILSIIILFAIIFSLRYDSQVIAAEAFLLGYMAPIVIGNITIFSLFYSVLLSIGLAFISFSRGWTNLSYGGLMLSYIIHGIWLGNNPGIENLSLIHSVFILAYISIFTILAIFVKSDQDGIKEKNYASEAFIYLAFGIGYFFFFIVKLKIEMLASLVLLLLGVIILTFRQRLNYLVLISAIGTYITQWIWLGSNYLESNMPTHMIFATIYLVLFTIVSFMQREDVTNVITQLLNTFFYLGLMLVPLRKFYPDWDGLFALALAIFYLIAAYIAYNKENKYLFNTFVLLCVSYLALAVPLQLGQGWVTIFWAIEALLLLLLSFRLKEDVLRVFSTIVAGAASFRLLVYDSWALAKFDLYNLIGSTRFFSFIIVIIILYTVSYIYARNKNLFDNYDTYMKYIAIGLSIAATFLTTVIFTIEIMQSSGIGDMKQMWISVAWIIQALIILVYGFTSSKRVARIIGIVIFFISIFKIFLFDLSMLDTIYRIISFFVLGIILLLAAFLYHKYRDYI
ncbi:MAG: DUF2339 domain-containing protein [Nanoarchaeota archaeon]|nr:DUF2339 domain-containing protein [Nanoarchaeota archaeon]